MTKGTGKYTFVERADEQFMAVRLTDVEYGGLIFRYGKIKFGPVTATGECHVKYDYTVLENPGQVSNEVMDGREFVDLLGDVLVDIVEQSLIEKREAELAVVGPPEKLATGAIGDITVEPGE